MSKTGESTYTPCLLTNTAYVSGYFSIASSKLCVRSSSLKSTKVSCVTELLPISLTSVLLLCGIFNDRHYELIKETQHSRLFSTLWNAFDLLNLLDFEAFSHRILSLCSCFLLNQ